MITGVIVPLTMNQITCLLYKYTICWNILNPSDAKAKRFLTVIKCDIYLGNHVLERLHNFGGFAFLVVREDASNDYDSSQDNAQI